MLARFFSRTYKATDAAFSFEHKGRLLLGLAAGAFAYYSFYPRAAFYMTHVRGYLDSVPVEYVA